MAVETNYQLVGLKELEARLIELDAIAGQKVVRRAVRRSLIALQRQAKSNARAFSKSGALAESIKIVNVRPKGSEIVQVQVGAKTKDKKAIALHNLYYTRKRRGIYYGHMIEGGFTVGKSSPVKVPGRPWFVPAFNATKSGIIPEFRKILETGVKRLEKRAKQKVANAEGLVDP